METMELVGQWLDSSQRRNILTTSWYTRYPGIIDRVFSKYFCLGWSFTYSFERYVKYEKFLDS